MYHNNRDGTFEDVTAQSGLGRSVWAAGITVGDYDNDSFDDIFITCWGQNILYHNDRKGFFSTMFDYGTLTIETAGAVDNFVLTYCPHPDHYAKEILEARQKVRSMRHEA